MTMLSSIQQSQQNLTQVMDSAAAADIRLKSVISNYDAAVTTKRRIDEAVKVLQSALKNHEDNAQVSERT